MRKFKPVLLLSILFLIVFPEQAAAGGLEINFKGDTGFSSSVDVFLIVLIASFIPQFVIALTPYVQIIIVLSLARQAIGTPTVPPNLVLSGIALIITIFLMAPITSDIIANAIEPYSKGEIEMEEMVDRVQSPLQEYAVNNASDNFVAFFAKVAGIEERFESREDVPFMVASAANVMTQVTKALGIGAAMMVIFIVIDMFVAVILMILGIFMLPPHMISLPIKILSFLAAGGFELVLEVVLLDIKI